jgi:hypothetical protein
MAQYDINFVFYIFCITIGFILFFSSLCVMILFLCYKELRHGVYGMIIGTISSEVLIGFHTLLNGLSGIFSMNKETINPKYCNFDGTFTVFCFCFWCTQNICIMFLSIKRKLTDSKLTKILFFLSFTSSIIVAFISFNAYEEKTSVGETCFMSNFDGVTLVLIFILFSLKLIASVTYNFWFYVYRDTSKDRRFINGYNFFLIITSFLISILLIDVIVVYYYKIQSIPLNYVGGLSFFICCLYISYFRLKIEYFKIFLEIGPTKSKIINLFMFLGCCYRKPKFREIKKFLNVKLIIHPNTPDLNDTIYSKILKSADI